MAYDSTEARTEMLAEIVRAIDEIAVALAALGEAYEQLDDSSADRLEEQLFGPVQTAYGRAKRTHDSFAERAGLPAGSFAAAPDVHPQQAADYLESALERVEDADVVLSDLQDSLAPIEIGDRELREGLSEVRQLLAPVPSRGQEFFRVLGR